MLQESTSCGQEAVQQRAEQVQSTLAAGSGDAQSCLEGLQEKLSSSTTADVQTAMAASKLSLSAHAHLQGNRPGVLSDDVRLSVNVR